MIAPRRLLLLAAAFLALFASPARATIHEHEEWLQLFATGQVYGRVRAFVELQPRFGEDHQDGGSFDLRSVLARGALGYEVLKGWTLWAGYGYTPVYDPDRDESRIFQQSQYDWQAGPFKLQNRTRLEQRFLEHESDVSWRLRNQLRLVYPLPKWPTWSLVAADEVFLNLNTVTEGPEAGFDQNRLFLGVGKQLTPHWRVETDYLNHYTHRTRGKADSLGNGLFVQVAYNW